MIRSTSHGRLHVHSSHYPGLLVLCAVQCWAATAIGSGSQTAFQQCLSRSSKHGSKRYKATLMGRALHSDTSDYRQIFLNDTPLLDVRAHIEFEKGAFPNTENCPILNDEHRAFVGTCYKRKGAQAAQELGHTLVVESNLKETLVRRWKTFAEAHPEGYLYCFRGGLRSHIAQEWMKEAGVDYPLVVGGYKAMRRFLMAETDEIACSLPIVLLGGRTATGKTQLLKRLGPNVIDLEYLAKHRGSSFGALPDKQPSQIDFENSLAVELLKLKNGGGTRVFMEDESRRIGQRILPFSLYTEMAERYPMVILEAPMHERVEKCVQDYVTDLFPLFEKHYGPVACRNEFHDWFLQALFRIKKRLGSDRYMSVHAELSHALDAHASSGDESRFYAPLETLLKDFYDPMYDYQLRQKQNRVLFRGTADEIVAWAETYSPNGFFETPATSRDEKVC